MRLRGRRPAAADAAAGAGPVAVPGATSAGTSGVVPGAGPAAGHVLTAVADLVERQVATVEGVVVALTDSPVGASPALHAHLADDDRPGAPRLEVVWLGRRSLGAVAPGARMRVHGRVCRRAGAVCVYNPRYELLAVARPTPGSPR